MSHILLRILSAGIIIALLFIICNILNGMEDRKIAEIQKRACDRQDGDSSAVIPVKFHKKYRNTILMSCFLSVHLIATLTGVNLAANCDTPAKATILSIRTTKKSNSPHMVYHAKISYMTHENKAFRGTISSSDGQDWRVGDQLNILYEAKMPRNFTTPVQSELTSRIKSTPEGALQMLFGLIFVYTALLLIMYNFDKERLKKQAACSL